MSLLERIETTVASAPPGSEPLYLVDADRLPYLASLLADSADLCPNNPEPAMRHILDKLLDDLRERLGVQNESRIVYFLSTKSFRHELHSGYKANRRKAWAPPQRDLYVRCFRDMVNPWIYNGYEADDLVGIVSTYSPNCIIISNDKDLDQLPGEHYDPAKRVRYSVSPEEARFFKFYQWIAGDSGDGYGGIYRVGPVKAKDFLAGINHDKLPDDAVAKHIRNFYKKKGQLKDCETTRRLAWILTDVLGAPPVQPTVGPR